MMELKDFVAATLIQIVEGVRNAQSEVEKMGIAAIVSPAISANSTGAQKQGMIPATAQNCAQNVEFDVELLTVEEKEKQGGIGIFVGSLVIGGKGQSNSGNSAVNHVKFVVPLVLPSIQTKA